MRPSRSIESVLRETASPSAAFVRPPAALGAGSEIWPGQRWLRVSLQIGNTGPRGRNGGHLAVCEMIGHDVFQIRVDADGGAA